MFNLRKFVLSITTVVLILSFVMPVSVSAEVKGSTQYLINHAKNSKHVGKRLHQVKKAIKSQGYNGWKMKYNFDWCAWYMANCANMAYVGNYSGSPSLSKNKFASTMANYFAKYNGTSKKYPRKYSPKAGDIVVEGWGHIGIMISSSKAAFGNDGSYFWSYSTVKIRKPVNVSYYIPRANWYIIHYSDGLSKTSITSDMRNIPVKKAKFGVNTSTSSKKFARSGYTYSYWYMYKQDFNKKTGKYTNYYYSKNNKTGKYKWVKLGTPGYTKHKKKVGSKILFYYDSSFAGAKIILTPAWVKINNKVNNDKINNDKINNDKVTNDEVNNDNVVDNDKITNNEMNNDKVNEDNVVDKDKTTDDNTITDSEVNNDKTTNDEVNNEQVIKE